MVFYIDQTFFSLKDKYAVVDSANKLLYSVTSPTFAVTSRFRFFDKDETEVAYVKRLPAVYGAFIWYPSKQHSSNKDAVGVLEEDVKFTKKAYDVFLKDDVQWRVLGNFMAWDFTITEGENTIATIQKDVFNLKDVYAVKLTDDKNLLDVAMVAVMVDNLTHSKNAFRLFK